MDHSNIDKLGPDIWYMLHYVCQNNVSEKLILFLKLFGYIFNCEKCSEEYLKSICNSEITSPKLWLFNYHNKINKSLNKQIFKIEDLCIYEKKVNYQKIINSIKCISVNLNDTIVDLGRFKRFLKLLYSFKPFLFKISEREMLIKCRNMGISRLEILYLSPNKVQ